MSARVRPVTVAVALVLASTMVWVAPEPVAAATFTVTTTADDGPGSLRVAIIAANVLPDADTIDFDIPGTGPHTIALASALPSLNTPMVIDGTTQTGFTSCDDGLMVAIDGAAVTGTTQGFLVQAAVTIRGLAVHRFDEPGSSGIYVRHDSAVIECNFVGTDATGTVAMGNAFGVRLEGAPTLGGGSAGQGNLISGNAAGAGVLYTGGYIGARILGNKIGTSRTGLAALPNLYGVDVGFLGTATIGDTAAGEGNLISGNTNSGIRLRGPDSVVQNNRIGLSSGIGPLGNGTAGIEIGSSTSTTNNTIGGRGPGEGNVIARNVGAGIEVRDNNNDVVGNEISGNTMFNNGGLGITVGASVAPRPNDAGDVDLGPNRGQNYPVLTAASTTTIDGTLDSVAGATYGIEFFANAGCDGSGYGEGSRYVGALTGQAPGAFTFNPSSGAIAVGEVITATATNETTGDTSEFSACMTAQAPPDPFDCPDATDAVVQAQPPANLRLNGSPSTGAPTFQSDECIFLFEEQQNVPLPGDIAPFAPKSSGMAEEGAETVLLAQGRVVSSYVLHADALTAGGDLQGSWTFDERILGVFVGLNNLEITDSMVGLSGPGGITYEGTHTTRGLEFNTVDTLSVPASNPRTLNVRFSFGSATMDEIRVFTGIGPEDCVPPPTSDIVEASPPADLSENGSHASNRPKYESDECLFLFTERQNVTLPQDINPSAPTTTNIMTANKQRRIPQGTVVDGYLIHGDRIGAPTSNVRLQGTWTFPEPILGISAASTGLQTGDGLVGLSTITYDPVSGASDPRGLEAAHGDSVRVSSTDPHTIIVDFTFSAMDEIRVWTGVIDPPDVCPSGTPILRAYPPADLSLDGADPDTAPKYEDACIYLFEEAVDVPLSEGINVVAPKTSGNMVSSNPGMRSIRQNTVVSSYLLHADFPGPSPDPTGTTIGGTWTFDAPILGVSYTLSELKAGETRIGHPAITYEQTASFRGLETGGTDIVRVSPTDPNTLIVEFAFNAMDEIRVWTGVIDPPDPCPSGTPILQAFPPADLSLDGADPDPSPKYEDACIYLFEEAVDIPIGQTINPVAPKSSGNMVSATPKTRTIPQNTIVSSYLLHADFPGPSPDPTGTTIGGTWTFEDPILAVSYTQSGLLTGDGLVGHPSITYEGSSSSRGLETGGSDIVRVSPTDPNTIIVEFAFNAMDELRVWTGVVTPPICDPSPTNPIVAAFPPADLSQDGADPDPALTYEHDACLFVFDEGEHALSQDVNPVAPKTSGNMVAANPGTRRIPAGTVVETFLIHGDAIGPTPSPTGAEITASWTFDQPILAVSYRRDGLLIGDGLVGHPSITYDETSTVRGLEVGSPDALRVSPTDPKTLLMTFAYNAMDEIRVWTGVIGPQPGTIRVIKDSTPNSEQDVVFSTTDLDPAEFVLDDDGDATLPSSISFSTAPGDGYAVAETVPDGWDLTSATCDDGSPVTNIDVSSGETVTCTFNNVQRGRIIVVKQVLPDGSPETFEFDPSWGPNFSLGDGESHDSGLLVPNLYSVAELPHADWAVASATCDDGSQPDSIVLSSGEVVTCTFTNQRARGGIVVRKVASGAAQSFEFTASWSPTGFSLADGDQHDSGPLEPGSYSVSEAAVAGWDLTSATCDDGSPPGSIDLGPGETVICTFTNVQRGRIIIKKETLPDGSTQSFTFDVSWSGTDVTLQDGGSHDSGLLVPDLYSVTEAATPDWSITSATCDDESQPDAIGLSAGETVTCTFINQQAGRITVVKDARPDGPTDFTFVDNIPGCDIGTLDDDLDPTLPAQAMCLIPDPGTFSVTESDPGPGYPLEALSCDDADSTVDATSRTATIVVGAGEHVTCTFINVAPPPPGTIRVIKQTDPDGSTQTFTFDPSWSTTDFTLTDGQVHEATGLAAGNYSVSESPTPDWSITSATCDDGSTPDSIELAAGETVTCTFVNQQAGRITIVKDAQPDGGTAFTFTDDIPGCDIGTLDDDADGTLLREKTCVTTGPGTFSVSENDPGPGYTLEQLSCDDADSTEDVPTRTATIVVAAGEHVTCTFTNVAVPQTGTIRVIKQTDPDGSTQPFIFNPSWSTTDFTLTDGQTHVATGLMPGTHSVVETVPSTWDLSGTSCTDGSPASAISLEAGETVTCTFTNTQRGRIIVDKVTQPANDPQSFAFSLTGGPNSVNQSFNLTDAAAPRDSGFTLRAGTYTLAETVPTGWELTGRNCSGDLDGTFTLNPGQTVTCVFTNTKRTPPTIEKWQRNLDAGGNLTRNAIDAQVGDRIVYELRVRNPGPGTAASIVVDDLIPDGMRVTSRGICTGGQTGLQVCDLGSFAPGQTKTVTIEARVYLGCTVVGSRGADTLGESLGGGVYDDGVTDGPDVICGVGGGDTMLFGQGGQDQIFGDQPLPVPGAALINRAWVDDDGSGTRSGTEAQAQTTVNPVPANDADDKVRGGPGNDSIYGQVGGDELRGEGGNDFIRGSVGTDSIFGDDGDDELYGDEHADTVEGGIGHDLIHGDLAAGAPADDILRGQQGNDRIFGWGGHDSISGSDGNDDIAGGDGNDSISGDDGVDSIDGNDGNDVITGGESSDVISGGNGADTINGGQRGDTIRGDAGNDTLTGDGSAPTPGPDTITGGTGSDRIVGNDGNDQIDGNDGNDDIDGNDGADNVDGGAGADRIDGGNDGDRLSGGDDNDTINGGNGEDTIVGNTGEDALNGGAHDDILQGASGNDVIHGDGGNDRVDGGPLPGSRNRLYGDAGNADFCSFGPGDPSTDYRDPSCELPSPGTGWP